MNISKRVTEKLEELTAERPELEAANPSLPSQPGYVFNIQVEEQNTNVIISLADQDRYSGALRQLEVNYQDKMLNEKNVGEYLRHCAAQIVHRLTYLEEPLALVELDKDEGVAQLRSHPPRHDHEAVIYWEAEVSARPNPRVRLVRYRSTLDDTKREALAHPVTFVTLGQIAQDLALSLAES